MPVLFGEEPDPRERVFRAGQTKRVLLLFPKARAGVRTDRGGGHAAATISSRQGAAVAVRRPPEQSDTVRRPTVHGQRVEVV